MAAERIHIQDIPFEMFAVFSGNNKYEYFEMMSIINRLTQANLQEAVSYDLFCEEVAKDSVFGEIDRDRISQMTRKIAGAKMIRRQMAYDIEDSEWKESILLTGYGRKFLAFVEDISRPDLEEAGEYRITTARRIMRDLTGKEELQDNRSDLLMAVYTSLRDLIAHLGNFNAEFTDYINREAGGRVRNAKEASEWVHKVINSRYIIEYYTISDDSLGYLAQVSEISRNIEMIENDSDLRDMIVQDKKRKLRELIDKRGIDRAGEEQAEAEIDMQIRRIREIADIEYRVYMEGIANAVTTMIKRMYIMYSAFGVEAGGDNLVNRLTQFIRYIEQTDDTPSMDGIMNLYGMRIFTEDSLTSPLKKAEEEKYYPDPVYLYGSEIREGNSRRTKTDAVKKYLADVMDGIEKIRLDSLPCEDRESFLRLVRIVYLATENENSKKMYDTEIIDGEPSETEKNGYVIPNISIVRRTPAGTAQERRKH